MVAASSSARIRTETAGRLLSAVRKAPQYAVRACSGQTDRRRGPGPAQSCRSMVRLDSLSIRAARRLALAKAGLLTPERTGLPRRARGRGPTAFAAAQAVIRRFGYLQLDTVS